jgi:hypothetical protein
MTIENDILYHHWSPKGCVHQSIYKQIVLPKSLRKKILYECHESIFGGHLGFFKTLMKIKERFFWPRMWKDIEKWVRTCKVCSATKSPRTQKPGKMIPIGVNELFEQIGIDLLGPLHKTNKNNKFIVDISDYFTKWVEAFPLPDGSAKEIATVLVEQSAIKTFVKPIGLRMIGRCTHLSYSENVIDFSDNI